MKKILIVEDDQKIAMALMIRLKANGYSASLAADVPTGISQARLIRPDMILLDISLPGGDGLKLADTFLQMPETSATPVIFITASKSRELVHKVMEVGAVGLFEKPFDMEALLNSIDKKFNSQADLLHARQAAATHRTLEF